MGSLQGEGHQLGLRQLKLGRSGNEADDRLSSTEPQGEVEYSGFCLQGDGQRGRLVEERTELPPEDGEILFTAVRWPFCEMQVSMGTGICEYICII